MDDVDLLIVLDCDPAMMRYVAGGEPNVVQLRASRLARRCVGPVCVVIVQWVPACVAMVVEVRLAWPMQVCFQSAWSSV